MSDPSIAEPVPLREIFYRESEIRTRDIIVIYDDLLHEYIIGRRYEFAKMVADITGCPLIEVWDVLKKHRL